MNICYHMTPACDRQTNRQNRRTDATIKVSKWNTQKQNATAAKIQFAQMLAYRKHCHANDFINVFRCKIWLVFRSRNLRHCFHFIITLAVLRNLPAALYVTTIVDHRQSYQLYTVVQKNWIVWHFQINSTNLAQQWLVLKTRHFVFIKQHILHCKTA